MIVDNKTVKNEEISIIKTPLKLKD